MACKTHEDIILEIITLFSSSLGCVYSVDNMCITVWIIFFKNRSKISFCRFSFHFVVLAFILSFLKK